MIEPNLVQRSNTTL